MELSYVVSAVRRYWWALTVCLIIGTAGALRIKETGPIRYASHAAILVAPPTNYAGASYLPDRYVAAQIAILGSQATASAVAARVGGGLTDESVSRYLKIDQAPGSDIIELTVTTPEPKRAQQIAAVLVDTYFEQLRAQAQQSQKSALGNLDDQLSTIQSQLTKVDADITKALARYVTQPSPGSGAYAIPTVDQVAPDLASQKAALLSQYEEVRSAKTKLEVGADSVVTSQVVQAATLPTAPVPRRGKILLAGGILAGGFFGVVSAVVLARISRNVIDQREISEILEQPIEGVFPTDRRLSTNRLEALMSPSESVRAFVDGLCVRAQTNSAVGEALVIAVTATRRSAGTSTLAASLSRQFAASGLEVLLVDADPLNFELSRLLAPHGPGMSAVLAAARGMPFQSPDGSIRSPFVSTSIAGLQFVGASSKTDAFALRRQDVQDIINAASVAGREVIVFDGGSLLRTASASRLAQAADVVLLAVPLQGQDRRDLATAARQLQNHKVELLAVAMPSRARSRFSSRARSRFSQSSEHPVAPPLMQIRRERADLPTPPNAETITTRGGEGVPAPESYWTTGR